MRTEGGEWAALHARQRNAIGSVIDVLNQIEDGEITEQEEGTLRD